MSAAHFPNGRDRSVARLMGEVAIAAEARSARCASTERCTIRTSLVNFVTSVSQTLVLLGMNVSDAHLLTCHSLLTSKLRRMVRCLQRSRGF